jgi:predicted RNase H-like nuclease (RuvC/YqgF family)
VWGLLSLFDETSSIYISSCRKDHAVTMEYHNYHVLEKRLQQMEVRIKMLEEEIDRIKKNKNTPSVMDVYFK